ncbi:MAG: dUTP diphosphatase [Chloroflexi bacterium]|nr:dUTP diphosphatase [Chloroflexota bacterium]
MKKIRIAKIEAAAVIPTRKHPSDAGLDLYSLEAVTIEKQSSVSVRTGIALDIPDGYVGLILPKSRNNYILGGGVVDAGYQGEIKVKIINPSALPISIEAGSGIAQLLVVPIETPAVETVPLANLFAQKSERGESGGIHA